MSPMTIKMKIWKRVTLGYLLMSKTADMPKESSHRFTWQRRCTKVQILSEVELWKGKIYFVVGGCLGHISPSSNYVEILLFKNINWCTLNIQFFVKNSRNKPFSPSNLPYSHFAEFLSHIEICQSEFWTQSMISTTLQGGKLQRITTFQT